MNLKIKKYGKIIFRMEYSKIADRTIAHILLIRWAILYDKKNEELVLQPVFSKVSRTNSPKFIVLVVKIQILHILRGHYFLHFPK
jgi:hypothetical protein